MTAKLLGSWYAQRLRHKTVYSEATFHAKAKSLQNSCQAEPCTEQAGESSVCQGIDKPPQELFGARDEFSALLITLSVNITTFTFFIQHTFAHTKHWNKHFLFLSLKTSVYFSKEQTTMTLKDRWSSYVQTMHKWKTLQMSLASQLGQHMLQNWPHEQKCRRLSTEQLYQSPGLAVGSSFCRVCFPV